MMCRVKALVERLQSAEHQLAEKTIVPDDLYQIRAVVSRWIADPKINAIISTGGTGVTGRDGTPEAVTPLLDKVLDGFGEIFRMLSYQDIKNFYNTIPCYSRCCQWHLYFLPAGFIGCMPYCLGCVD